MNRDYEIKLTRRDGLKWMAAISATASVPFATVASLIPEGQTAGHWPDLPLKPIKTAGYGKDPNLLVPPKSPWPKTLTQRQLNLVARLSDIIVPREGRVPSGAEVGVPDVIDEWVSAPYVRQQQDRVLILNGLAWLDDESALRYSKDFLTATVQQQIAIIDDIAYQGDGLKDEFVPMAKAFDRLRNLVLAAFFCSPEGTKDLGYQGNVPILGDYPGPSEAAMTHLNKILDELGLTL